MTQAEFNQMLQTAIAGGAAGGYYTSKWSGEEIDRTLGTGNLNLLDNWYFPDPINQRGKTVYAGAVHGIDRWKGVSAKVKLVIDNAGVSVTRNPSADLSNTLSIQQTLESFLVNYLRGKVITLSAYVVSCNDIPRINFAVDGTNNIVYGVVSSAPQIISKTLIVPSDAESIICLIGKNTGSSYDDYATFAAAKLELGAQQTLAHQDASGNWVLNDPPPNKALELEKCQRYQSLGYLIGTKIWISNNKHDVGLFFPLNIQLHKSPTLVGNVSYLINGSSHQYDLTTSNVTGLWNRENGVYIYIQKSDVDFTNVSYFFVINGGFDANL